ncbi:FHA domain-containing protein [Streptosporangium subroseum]|uniref:FHA domain-containing protein n=1 Tax=Streptosporangium subroseum TaxID=106412 RepID=A0A239P8Q1_9ACTN|nr:FHA domain-containing protein [Streptosporangium subroseum]SNT63431.1 FHA domain-containing protein [Streptosporangium subroseum]
MPPTIVGREGPLAGRKFPISDASITFGRRDDNNVVIASGRASRFHAEVVREADGYVLYDRGSQNGTLVNGSRVASHILQPGDLITIGNETFCFEASNDMETIMDALLIKSFIKSAVNVEPESVLHVTISGGGPVGLSLALLLEHFMGPRVAITLYDGRWIQEGSRIIWKNQAQGNVRRQQVVTIQSRQYLNLPEDVQERLFRPESYSEMWPSGPDSIRGYGPRNIRIAYIEDTLLEIANEKSDRIRLVPARFDPAEQRETLVKNHVLAICEGGRSRTRDYFTDKFGNADKSIYSLDGQHIQDVVLGLQVKSDLSDPMTVLLTVAQNRFLLNALRGEGFLNMRLTDAEAQEVIGIDPVRHVFEECIASRPCLMGRTDHGEFHCSTHGTLFLPALIKSSALWKRVMEGLVLFGVSEENLSAITAFRLDMVQRPRFTAQLYSATATTPGTYGFLLGDAANAIHFWPGRGLNSGLASAISLARSLNRNWRGKAFRDADFLRHEAAMSMLQYRHKSRAWKAMVTTDEHGVTRAIKDIIVQGIKEGDEGSDRDADINTLMEQLRQIRSRLSRRIPGMPDEKTLDDHLRKLKSETLRTLLTSGAWDTLIVGGEEVDIDIFDQQDSPAAPVSKTPPVTASVEELPEHTKLIWRGSSNPISPG